MMYKIGLIVMGLVSLISFLAAGLLILFNDELVQKYPTPPPWLWWLLGGWVLLGLTGLIVAVVECWSVRD